MADERLTKELRSARRQLLREIAGVADETLRRRGTEAEWCIVEVLAHLVDVDRHWLAQALAIRDDPRHLFAHFDDAKWKAEHPDAQALPLRRLLSDLESSFRQVVETLKRLSAEELERAGRHPREVAYRVRDVFLRYPAHDRNHARQIRTILEAVSQ